MGGLILRVSIVLEQRFIHTADGATFDDAHATYAHWQRYLSTFEEVQVVGRSQLVQEVPPGYRRVDGPGVTVLPVPFYQGPLGLLRRWPQVSRALLRGIEPQDAVIVRLAGLLGHLAGSLRFWQRQPFAVEVVNDPYEVYGPGSMHHPLRPVFQQGLTALTRWQCRKAVAVQYVTRQALQRRYPARSGQAAYGVSDVHLPPAAFGSGPRFYTRPARLAVLVGRLEQLHKGADVAIAALAHLRARGHDLRLRIVGDGLLRPDLERQAQQAGVGSFVEFTGQRSTPAEVRQDLREADLFLMPSRHEGLPRALVEAMAQGLPAIGSEVGGIPELLAAPYLVQPGSVEDLARAWQTLALDPAALSRASARNYHLAQTYADDVLDAQRTAFQRAVRAATPRGPGSVRQ